VLYPWCWPHCWNIPKLLRSHLLSWFACTHLCQCILILLLAPVSVVIPSHVMCAMHEVHLFKKDVKAISRIWCANVRVFRICTVQWWEALQVVIVHMMRRWGWPENKIYSTDEEGWTKIVKRHANEDESWTKIWTKNHQKMCKWGWAQGTKENAVLVLRTEPLRMRQPECVLGHSNTLA